MLLGGAEPNDKRPVVGKHRLVPRYFGRKRRKGILNPGEHLSHPGTVCFILNSR